MAEVAFYRCNLCKNVVALLHNGGGSLSCCGQKMTKLKANSTDAAQEKHVPVVSTLHPMQPEHYIEWIALFSGDKVEFKFLKPGEEPKAEFEDVDSGTVYEYCNLHGLWKADF